VAKPKKPKFQHRPTRSWAEVEAICAERVAIHKRKEAGLPQGSAHDSITNSESFAGTPDMATAQRFLAGGWSDGTKAVADGLDRVMTEMAEAPTWSHDVGGAFVDVPAFIAGDAECMWVRDVEEAPRPRVRLVFNTSYTCWVEQATVVRYAIALAAVVRKVEAEGMDVEIVAIDCKSLRGRGSGVDVVSGIEVRKFGQPLDLSKVAFAAHPSFLRRVIFAVREMDAELPVSARSMGYAYTTPITPEVVEAAYTEGATHAVVLPEIDDLAPKLTKDADILAVAVPAMLAPIKAAIARQEV
jgi:hypothetical protein